MRSLLLYLVATLIATTAFAAEPSARNLVAQLYQAHRSKHDPLEETALLGHYFETGLVKLYLQDKQEAKGEVGRLDGGPLYNAQEIDIRNFSVAEPEETGREARVAVTFKNLGKSTFDLDS